MDLSGRKHMLTLEQLLGLSMLTIKQMTIALDDAKKNPDNYNSSLILSMKKRLRVAEFTKVKLLKQLGIIYPQCNGVQNELSTKIDIEKNLSDCA